MSVGVNEMRQGEIYEEKNWNADCGMSKKR